MRVFNEHILAKYPNIVLCWKIQKYLFKIASKTIGQKLLKSVRKIFCLKIGTKPDSTLKKWTYKFIDLDVILFLSCCTFLKSTLKLAEKGGAHLLGHFEKEATSSIFVLEPLEGQTPNVLDAFLAQATSW